MERKLVFRRSGKGAFGTANNEAAVVASGPLDGLVEVRLIAPAWREAPEGSLAREVKMGIKTRLVTAGVYPEGPIELLTPDTASGGCLLVRFRAGEARMPDSASMVEFAEVTRLRPGLPTVGKLEVVLPPDSPLRECEYFTYPGLQLQMGVLHGGTVGRVAVAVANEALEAVRQCFGR